MCSFPQTHRFSAPDLQCKHRDIIKLFRLADKGGQGLELAITHAIISEHEGTIEVSSEKGKGTAFTLSLPLLT